MTVDPETLPSSSPQDDGELNTPSLEPLPYFIPAETFPCSTSSEPPVPPAPRDVPNIGHSILLFIITAVFWLLAEMVCLGIATALTPGHERVHAMALANDPRLLVASEAIGYALAAGFAALIFPIWWHRRFSQGIHWNWPTARRRAILLVALGLVVGFSMTLFGSFLPMPKDPPIVKDIMSTPAGAWVMFLFAISGAPLFEEFVFRGFLLPSLINLFKWMGRRDVLSAATVRAIGVPLSVVLTTIPFALMHSPQLSGAWGPLLLIGMVSLVLCAVRLAFDSLAASTIVHAAYNFTLFAGIMVSTGGFRHLDKLAG